MLDDDTSRRRWERATEAIDTLNRKYGRTPPGGYAGGLKGAKVIDEGTFDGDGRAIVFQLA